jgi:hypothetical protein
MNLRTALVRPSATLLSATLAVLLVAVAADVAGSVSQAREAPVLAANLVYSPAHGKVLGVSGTSDWSGSTVARVWSWDGRRWSLLDGAGPQARMVAAAAYDEARGQLILVGGVRPKLEIDEMWTWSAATWRQVGTGSLGPRDHHVMAYDTMRGRAVLFGGSGARPPGAERRLSPVDTWEWDGDRWAQVATTGPSSRGRSAMVYDERRREVVLFGGGGDQVLGDTWIWNGTTWRQAAAAGPAPRYAHSMAYDADRGVVVLYGGSTFRPVQYFTDMWEWNGERWTEVAMSSGNPGPRYSAGLAYDKNRRKLVLYGGASVGELSKQQPYLFDTWEWDGRQWTEVR